MLLSSSACAACCVRETENSSFARACTRSAGPEPASFHYLLLIRVGADLDRDRHRAAYTACLAVCLLVSLSRLAGRRVQRRRCPSAHPAG